MSSQEATAQSIPERAAELIHTLKQFAGRAGLCLALSASTVVGTEVLPASDSAEASTPTATVGMPFTGKWAYNQNVNPDGNGNYNDNTSSHPSVHHRYYGDWATDLYEAAGSPVKLHVSSNDGPVTFSFNKLHDSCSSVGPNIAGHGIVLNVLVNGAAVGSIDYEHLDDIPSSITTFTNDMTIGTITNESLSSTCYSARHTHIELKNSDPNTYSCWADHGNPGNTVNEGEAIGILGSNNSGAQQKCTTNGIQSLPISASNGHIPYAVVGDGRDFYTDEGWAYEKVGGAAFVIGRKDGLDTNKWGEPTGPVPVDETHDHEVDFGSPNAHPPRDYTTVYLDGDPQQWTFFHGRAYAVGPGELGDLGAINNAVRVPQDGRLGTFEGGTPGQLPQGTVYRFAGDNRVSQMVQQPDGSWKSFWVNNDTLRNCLAMVQGHPVVIIPEGARPYIEDGVYVSNETGSCSFPSG